MSVSGISSSNFFSQAPESLQSRMQQFQKEFQQLGQDLQSGNLAAAQSDAASLLQLGPQRDATASAAIGNPITRSLNQLSQDLQSGNLPAAQQDFATIQQDMQSQSSAAQGSEMHHYHHHHHAADASGSSPIAQEFAQLGQALSSGNLSSAQQAYSLLQQSLPSFQNSSPSAPAPSSATSLSVSA